jgi:hypothetical protein
MSKLSGAGKVLVVLLVAYVVADILLTPLAGLETRNPALVTTLGFGALGLLFLGLLLAIVSIVLLFRGSRRASPLAVIGALLYFPAVVTELTGRFSKLSPPTAISRVELIQTLIAVLVIFVALWANRGKR